MAALYVWLRRHPMLVDGLSAAVLGFLGLGSAITHGRYATIPFVLALVSPLLFRRKHPIGAFATAVIAGAAQVLLGVRFNVTDLAVVILLYTLAAYRPRRTSLVGLAICLAGSAVAMARWAPQLSLPGWLLAGAIMFAGPSLIAWVLGDSTRHRRAYHASLEGRAARLAR